MVFFHCQCVGGHFSLFQSACIRFPSYSVVLQHWYPQWVCFHVFPLLGWLCHMGSMQIAQPLPWYAARCFPFGIEYASPLAVVSTLIFLLKIIMVYFHGIQFVFLLKATSELIAFGARSLLESGTKEFISQLASPLTRGALCAMDSHPCPSKYESHKSDMGRRELHIKSLFVLLVFFFSSSPFEYTQ